jgi:hypothetical protein
MFDEEETMPKRSLFSSLFSRIYALPIAIAFIAAATFFQGYVLSVLWGWFIMPTLHFAAITSWQGAGLMTFFEFIKYKYGHGAITDGTTLGSIMYMLSPFYIGGAFLLTGYLITLFM